jgi:hypothetical protein
MPSPRNLGPARHREPDERPASEVHRASVTGGWEPPLRSQKSRLRVQHGCLCDSLSSDEKMSNPCSDTVEHGRSGVGHRGE